MRQFLFEIENLHNSSFLYKIPSSSIKELISDSTKLNLVNKLKCIVVSKVKVRKHNTINVSLQ